MNKIYIVVGASSDVAMAYLQKLNSRLFTACERATVIAHFSRNKQKLEEICTKCSNIDVEYIQADLSHAEGIKKLILECNKILNNETPYAILHFPAPKFRYTKLKNIDWNLIENDMNISLHSLVEICKEYLPVMAKKREGRLIVLLSSVTDGQVPKFLSQYILIKYAMLGFVRAMSSDYEGKGIGITSISPDMMDTKFLSEIDPKIVELAKESKASKKLVDIKVVANKIDEIICSKDNTFSGKNIVIVD